MKLNLFTRVCHFVLIDTSLYNVLLVTGLFLSGNIYAEEPIDPDEIILQLRGSDTNSALGVNINCLGDMNGDGFSDIAVSSYSPKGTYVFFGSLSPDTIPDMFLRGASGPATAIDLTGDGINDVVVTNDTTISFIRSGIMYFYQGYGDSLASMPYDSLVMSFPNYEFGLVIKVAYVDSDSLGDILTSARDTPEGPTVYYYSGLPALDTIPDWTFKIQNYEHNIRFFEFIDFDGDTHLDIVLGLSQYLINAGFVYVFCGPTFSGTPDYIIGYPQEIEPGVMDSVDFVERGIFSVGDFDGDSWADLGVLHGNHGLIYRCGPGADTVYDYELNRRALYMARAGDLNGDVGTDLVTYNADRDEFMGVDIYLAGPEFDVYIDRYIVWTHLPPWFLKDIGYNLSPSGDFNGDGYDDFMFSCRNFFGESGRGAVFVEKGGPHHIPTGIDDETPNELPLDFILYQNYPNPFNPGTMIEFSLPRAEEISVTVYNVLGQQVRVLVNHQRYPAGNHRLFWDGHLENGNPASSGVYVVKLGYLSGSMVRKMLLLR